MTEPVTDPKLLALLNADQPVTDPAILAQLNAPSSKGIGDTIRSVRDAIHAPTRILENGFLFGLGDRARAGMNAGLDAVFHQPTLSDQITGGPSYSKYLADERAQTEQFKAAHPVAAPIIEGVGGLTTPLGVLGAASKGATLGAKALYGAGAGAGLGGLLGTTNSADWTNLPQTMRDAVFGAGTGAVVGGALPVISAGIGAGYNWLNNALQSTPGIPRSAAPHLVEALRADGVTGVQRELDRLGPNAMLADTGPAMLGKAQGASLNSDEGRSILQGALTQRNQGTNQRIMEDVNRALGPAEDPQTVTNAIRAYRAKVDSVAYPAALNNAPPVQTAHILTSLDHQISRSVGMERKALETARSMLTTEQNQMVGQTTSQKVRVSQNDAEVLHKVKQELDNVIQYDAPGLGVPAGAVSRQQGALKMLRAELNDALEKQVPRYATANRQSAALAKRADAVEAGTQYLGSGKTTPSPERFAAEFNPLSVGEQIAFAKGSRGNIERVLGTKANDLQALRGELQGEGGWNTAKLGTVHGQDAADQLIGSVDRNLKFRDTYNKVVENSQTAQRTAAANAMKPEPASATPFFNPNATLSGQIGTLMIKKPTIALYNALMKNDPTKAYGDVARILSAQGPEAQANLDALARILARRDAGKTLAGDVGNLGSLIPWFAANYARQLASPQDNR